MGLLGRLANRSRDVLFVPVLDRYWRRRLSGKVLCLLYHRVDEPANHPFMTQSGSPVIPPLALERELRFLQSQGAEFLTFAHLRAGQFPEDDGFGVIVSFDDGFRDNYTQGLEVLETIGIKGVFFQSTALIDGPTLIWEHALYWYGQHQRLRTAFADLTHAVLGEKGLAGLDAAGIDNLVSHLREQAPAAVLEELLERALAGFGQDEALAEAAAQLYPTADHIRCAHALGHEIGSHGHRHYKRTRIDPGWFEAELARSRTILERLLAAPPLAFSYPFNSYLPGDEHICARYFVQCATVDGRPISRNDNPHWLPRCTWPGPARNGLRQRRWLLTGRI